jgi:hypothetical protein
MKIILTAFLVLWIGDGMKAQNVAKVQSGFETVFHDSGKVDWTKQPRYALASNTNTTGRLLVVDERQLTNLKVDPATVTVEQLTQWATANLGVDKSKILIGRDEKWENAVKAMGLVDINPKEPTP